MLKCLRCFATEDTLYSQVDWVTSLKPERGGDGRKSNHLLRAFPDDRFRLRCLNDVSDLNLSKDVGQLLPVSSGSRPSLAELFEAGESDVVIVSNSDVVPVIKELSPFLRI